MAVFTNLAENFKKGNYFALPITYFTWRKDLSSILRLLIEIQFKLVRINYRINKHLNHLQSIDN